MEAAPWLEDNWMFQEGCGSSGQQSVFSVLVTEIKVIITYLPWLAHSTALKKTQ